MCFLPKDASVIKNYMDSSIKSSCEIITGFSSLEQQLIFAYEAEKNRQRLAGTIHAWILFVQKYMEKWMC